MLTHSRPLSLASGTAALLTTPSTIAENRLLSLATSRTIDADRRHVRVFDAAAERVGHHLLGEHPHELRRIAQQRLPQPDRSVDLLAVEQRRPSRRSACRRRRPASCASLASASKFSSAKPIGSMILWQPAHGRVGAVQRHLLAQRQHLAASPFVSSSAGTFGGGSGGGVPRMFSSTHTPRLTGERAEVLRPRDRQEAALAEQAAAVVQLRPAASRGGSASRRRSECRSACASRSLTNV